MLGQYDRYNMQRMLTIGANDIDFSGLVADVIIESGGVSTQRLTEVRTTGAFLLLAAVTLTLTLAEEPFDAARPVTADTKRPIPGYFWSRDSRFILFTQDQGGNENYNVYAVNPAKARALLQEAGFGPQNRPPRLRLPPSPT